MQVRQDQRVYRLQIRIRAGPGRLEKTAIVQDLSRELHQLLGREVPNMCQTFRTLKRHMCDHVQDAMQVMFLNKFFFMSVLFGRVQFE
jgi:hypothetical protein